LGTKGGNARKHRAHDSPTTVSPAPPAGAS